MANIPQDRDNQEDSPVDSAVAAYIASLDEEHKMLVILKSQLYSRDWDAMLDDLNNRLAGKPYIFKLTNRIRDDVERINEMRDFESAHGVDLADYVSLS